MGESLYVRFLYDTLPGRAALKLLVRPFLSKAVGRILDSRMSMILIPMFIRKNHIDTWDLLVPDGGFHSFNEFFARKRENEDIRIGQETLICPCDGLLSVIPIKGQDNFHIKHTKFSLNGLLRDDRAAAMYRDGYALIFRLTPAHYHRYLYAANGKIRMQKSIAGILHCVRPIVTEKIPVYVQNARKYQIIKTREFGDILQMEVGAMLVGKISNHRVAKTDKTVKAGEEKGYFEYGGSTVILLLQKDKVKMKDWVFQALHKEIPVRQGRVIAD